MLKKSFMKTTLTNVLPIDKTAQILELRLWTKLDSQQPVIDRSLNKQILFPPTTILYINEAEMFSDN